MTRQNAQASDPPEICLQNESNNDWIMCNVARCKAPPLRFKGRMLAHHAGWGAQSGLFVTLWARRKGDFVLAFSNQHGGVIQPDSVVAPTCDAAAIHLESLCQSISRSMRSITSEPLDQVVRTLGYHQNFLRLVGTALAGWDCIDNTTAPALTV